MAELKEQAISCLHRLRGAVIGEKASEEVDEILEELSFLGESEEASIGEIFQGKCLKALIIGAGLVLFQQVFYIFVQYFQAQNLFIVCLYLELASTIGR